MINLDIVNEKCDIKAEVIVAALIDRGNDENLFAILPNGAFSRTYRKDVLSLDLLDVDSSSRKLNAFRVSRDGMYDHLPQGLFHFHNPEKDKTKTLADKIEELKRYRAEEMDCRQVFAVLEREYNHCRVMIEMEERNSIPGLTEDSHSDLFLDIWPEIKSVDERYHKHLFQILPLAYLCREDKRLAGLILGYVLNVPVEISSTYEPYYKSVSEEIKQSFGMILGKTAILGNTIPVYEQSFKIAVSEVPVSRLQDFLEGGHANEVMHFLLEYFLPFDAYFETSIAVKKEEESLFLRSETVSTYLNYNSTI